MAQINQLQDLKEKISINVTIKKVTTAIKYFHKVVVITRETLKENES